MKNRLLKKSSKLDDIWDAVSNQCVSWLGMQSPVYHEKFEIGDEWGFLVGEDNPEYDDPEEQYAVIYCSEDPSIGVEILEQGLSLEEAKGVLHSLRVEVLLAAPEEELIKRTIPRE